MPFGVGHIAFVEVTSLLLLGAIAPAKASTVDVTYSVSGSAGDRVLDFSITNNLGGTTGIFAVNFIFSSGTFVGLIGHPLSWPDTGSTSDNSTFYRIFVHTFVDPILPGQTFGGFLLEDFDQVLPPITWSVIAVDGSEGFLVEGTAVAQTPLPAALPLFATGLGALGLLGWRRKRRAPTPC